MKSALYTAINDFTKKQFLENYNHYFTKESLFRAREFFVKSFLNYLRWFHKNFFVNTTKEQSAYYYNKSRPHRVMITAPVMWNLLTQLSTLVGPQFDSLIYGGQPCHLQPQFWGAQFANQIPKVEI